ncbi:hypothetical protein C8F04DRAFT_1223292 [Mycena alexandri]|uniref:Uncharacterized protein n=1 Tax=Mycena alexandri TaxID=1745969 RepID=A0AAD6SEZ8_9AGAR|nr:hypothetical protein C8F04DRAFT_1223292 [Mycena alexandri]
MDPKTYHLGELSEGQFRQFQSSMLRQESADPLFKAKKYKDACMNYLKAATLMLGRELPINGPFYLPEYARLAANYELADTLACLNGAAESLLHLRQYKQALWLAAEIEVVVRNVQMESTRSTPCFEWFDFEVQLTEYFYERLRARVLQQRIFRTLGNTGAANERRWHSTTLTPKHLETPEMLKIHPHIPHDPIYQLRHPDPKLVTSLTVTDPTLQVLGSWKKVALQKGAGITSRMGFAAFVFEGHLYVLGGEKHQTGPWYRDFWRMDLTALDEWQPLPAYPVSSSVIKKLVGYSMVVDGDCAYLFTGRRDLDVFNLRTQSWASLPTSLAVDSELWPYPTNDIVDYAMQTVGGKIYIFGGSHKYSAVGCTLLMELDVAARRWTRLSGTAQPKTASYDGPGPRRLACSWVGKDRNTLFVMYGDANRQAACIAGQQHGAHNAYAHDDLWAWDITRRVWDQRRLVGNTPAPRSEMACTYNPVLDKVVTFGGYAPTAPSHFGPENSVYVFSYYGDTFVLGTDTGPATPNGTAAAATPSWLHVLTRGFPTYRAQAQLAADPATGRTFLFGGYVNSEYVPSRSFTKHTSHVFGDMWELRLDVPGGGFGAVDVEDEARTARVGPWQRCFACGSVGPWRKCGGACNGLAFFCDGRCLKDGWTEHKIKHKCRK